MLHTNETPFAQGYMVYTQSGFLRNISRSAKWFIDQVGLRIDVPLIAQRGYHAKALSSLIQHEAPDMVTLFVDDHKKRYRVECRKEPDMIDPEIAHLFLLISPIQNEDCFSQRYAQRLVSCIRTLNHELRTPLSMVTTLTDIIKCSPEKELAEEIAVTLQSAEYLLYAVNFYAARGHEALQLRLWEFDAAAQVHRRLVYWDDAARKKGIELSWQLPDTVKVTADSNILQLLIDSLMLIAVNHATERVSVAFEMSHHLRFEISYDGSRVSERLLDMYEKDLWGTSESFGASLDTTGFSLFVVSWILSGLGGSIEPGSEHEGVHSLVVNLDRDCFLKGRQFAGGTELVYDIAANE
jgi:signal transduction histidine kinase